MHLNLPELITVTYIPNPSHIYNISVAVILPYKRHKMVLYLIIGVNVLLFLLLLRSMYKRNQQTNDSEYSHAVKRLFENNPDIKDKMKDKYRF